jgi:hypothetical protein
MVWGDGYHNWGMRSVANFAVPITMVAAMLVPTVLVGIWIGGLADKVDTVVRTTAEIKQGQYTQVDATKDLATVHAEINEVKHRVETLEQAQRRQVVLANNEDFLVRTSKWLSGKR